MEEKAKGVFAMKKNDRNGCLPYILYYAFVIVIPVLIAHWLGLGPDVLPCLIFCIFGAGFITFCLIGLLELFFKINKSFWFISSFLFLVITALLFFACVRLFNIQVFA